MNPRKNSLTDYEADYKILELEQIVDWATARAHYQKLVHKWHPDKFVVRPLELENAQERFIALSRSYNRLKEFHSRHQRLPFERAEPEKSRPDVTINVAAAVLPRKSNVDPDNLDLGTLSRDQTKVDERLIKKNPLVRILWVIIVTLVILGTAMLFLILDRKANQENMAIGRQVLKEAPESEFTPTPSEIRHSESKGLFLQVPE